MQCRRLGWLGASITCIVLAFGFGAGCTPAGPGNDNTVDNVNENGSGQPVPTELDIDIEGQGGVEQESIGNNLVQLTAVAEEGWAFDAWFGSVNSIENPLTVSPDDDTNIGARFVESAPPPVDTDGDGVADADDDCPNTVAGADVDTNGCAPNQLDSDGDGVANLDDICPETPADSTVNTEGCAPSELDTDTDGIADDIDACPETPDGVSVGADGCAPSEVDSDGDGVTDDLDNCPNTEEDVEVGDDGCPILDGCDGATGDCFTAHATGGCGDAVCCSLVCDFDDFCCTSGWDADCASIALDVCPNAPGGGGGPVGGGTPVCGDGTVSAGEECEPPNTDLCNASCRYICGNLFLQGNEQCDPPNGINCDSNCRIITDGPVSPQGDWLSTQYFLNGAAGLLAFGAPETYRLNASGALQTAFVTVDTNEIEATFGGDVAVLSSTLSPGVNTDVFSLDVGLGIPILFKAKIDAFSLAIAADNTTTWTFDYTVQASVTDPVEGEIVSSLRLTGAQTGTVGGDPSQIVWANVTGNLVYCDEFYDCELCALEGGTCDANQCCVYPLGTDFILLGDWTRSGG